VIFAILDFIDKRRDVRKQCAEQLLAAFKDVDLTRHQFNVTGTGTLTARSGEDRFYEVGEVDKAIDRINALLKEWR
jgi:hypothetical protein